MLECRVSKTKISIVRYLNAAPLAWGILEGPQSSDFQPVLSTPAECADRSPPGAVDIGLFFVGTSVSRALRSFPVRSPAVTAFAAFC
jgi:hypothetical protein